MKSFLFATVLMSLSLNAHAQVGAVARSIIKGAEKPVLTAVGTAVKEGFVLKVWPKNSLVVTAEKLEGDKIKSLSFRVAKVEEKSAQYDLEVLRAVHILEANLVRHFRIVSTSVAEDGARVVRVEFPPLGVHRITLNKALAVVESKLAESGHEAPARAISNTNLNISTGSR